MMDIFSLNLNFGYVKQTISDESEKAIKTFKGLYERLTTK